MYANYRLSFFHLKQALHNFTEDGFRNVWTVDLQKECMATFTHALLCYTFQLLETPLTAARMTASVGSQCGIEQLALPSSGAVGWTVCSSTMAEYGSLTIGL
jgi:hypothetical protein